MSNLLYPNFITMQGIINRFLVAVIALALSGNRADVLLSRWLTRFCYQALQQFRSRVCLLQISRHLLDQWDFATPLV
jgi:hypothetical protein